MRLIKKELILWELISWELILWYQFKNYMEVQLVVDYVIFDPFLLFQ